MPIYIEGKKRNDYNKNTINYSKYNSIIVLLIGLIIVS